MAMDLERLLQESEYDFEIVAKKIQQIYGNKIDISEKDLRKQWTKIEINR